MSVKRIMFVAMCLFLVMLASSAQCADKNQVSWVYNLVDNGVDNSYTYQFTFNNLGPDKDAIFKIQFNDCISNKWDTDSWILPTGWDSSQSGPNINFQTGNGDMSPDRIFGQAGGPAPGLTSQTFSWTFTNNGGPTPTSIYFVESDVTVHIQPLDDNWHNNGTSYPVNPVPEPSALAALGFSSLSLAGLVLRKRRR